MQRPELSSIPTTPGIYIYKDAHGRILYVGKAKHLRKRVASYFREVGLSSKTQAMLHHAVQIDTISTTTEHEALLLEASLIKKHRPRYNVLLRDDKDYIIFRIQEKHTYPRLEILRRRTWGQQRKRSTRNKDVIFGPFSSTGAARETWRAIHKAFPLRRCKDRQFSNRIRPCLYHHIKQCLAPCVLDVPVGEYAAYIQQVVLLLSGRSTELKNTLQQAMQEASNILDFEQAAQLRDRLQAIERTVERQAVVLADAVDLDVIGIAALRELSGAESSAKAAGLVLGVLFIRQGSLVDGRNFFWQGLDHADAPEVLGSFLTQFYGVELAPPARIVIPWALPDAPDVSDISDISGIADISNTCNITDNVDNIDNPDILGISTVPDAPYAQDFCRAPEAIQGVAPSVVATAHATSAAQPVENENTAINGSTKALEELLSYWKDSPVRITLPRSADEDSLVTMAASNAREAARTRSLQQPLPERLAARLGLAEPVQRIEAVDISHTGGTNVRAGMVVFENGQADKSAYRNYALDVPGGDDYAALAAWATRRAASGAPWPDLLLVDGGKGQLASVSRAFREAGVAEGSFAIAGIAKARNEQGRADRRAGNVADRIFIPGRANPLALKDGSEELLFLQYIRDTVHQWVIGRHRKARASAALQGELIRIPGIGAKTVRLLWEKFSSLEEMAALPEQELAAIPGIGKKRAAALSERLHLLVSVAPAIKEQTQKPE